ncbi:MAG: hypothetical protein P8104_07345, partial [Gammaproteobacteria bacterium]
SVCDVQQRQAARLGGSRVAVWGVQELQFGGVQELQELMVKKNIECFNTHERNSKHATHSESTLALSV